jgi:hypothetical protein
VLARAYGLEPVVGTTRIGEVSSEDLIAEIRRKAAKGR